VDVVRSAIDGSAGSREFRDLVLELAGTKGRILHESQHGGWSAVVLAVCQALGTDWRAARWPAAAIELIACATDVIDDLVDGEWDTAVAGTPRALNASFGLTWLAQRCAQRAVEDIGTERAGRIGELLAGGCLDACIGEDLDLLLELNGVVTEEEAHEASWRKSGSLIGMACQVGAACATDDPAVIEMASFFGRHVGMIEQLLNDIADVHPNTYWRSTDLSRRKKTLPVAYAIQVAREEGIDAITEWYDPATSQNAARTEGELAQALASSGALHYAWVIADVHRREAQAALRSLSELTGRKEVRGLGRLVPTLRLATESATAA
jgi:geranylgeranyl diphosphate synthase type I